MLRRRLTVAAVVMIGVGFVTTGQAYSHEAKTSERGDYTSCEKIKGQKVDIPLDAVADGDKGDIEVLLERAVAKTIQGNEAKVTFTSDNDDSVHIGSNLVLESDDKEIVLEDIEGEKAKVTESTAALTLGSTLAISIELGDDGVFSGGGNLQLEFTCSKDKATETTEAPVVEESTKCEKTPSFEVPVEKHMSGDAGETYVLAEFDVDEAFVGNEAALTFTGENNGSVREGSDLILTSGDNEVVLEDVEAEAGKVTQATGNLTLGETVELSVRLGEEGAFSGGGTLLLDIVCTEVEEEVEEPEPTTTVPPTTAAPTTEPPVEEITLAETGSDSTILSLFGTLLVLSGAVLMMGARLSRRIV